MAEVTNELIFEVLKQIQGDVSPIKSDLRDVKIRVTNLEEGQAAINRRLDRIDDRLDRMERRVGLVDNPLS